MIRRFHRACLPALALACAAGLAAPAHANSAAAEYFRSRADRTAVPTLLSQEDRTYYTQLFAAIERQDWTNVQTMLAQRSDGPLHAVARAQYYLAATSPKADLASLTDLIGRAPDLPWADQLGRLAMKRGATALPITPSAQAFAALPTTPRRTRPRSTADGTMPDTVAQAIQDRIKADDPMSARVLLDGIDAGLSPEARAEWRQKVGWSFYIENDDANARLVALSATQGGSGPWVAEALWTAGLAAWRMDDCMAAADAFQQAATQGSNPELVAAGYYWSSRALVRCRQPEKVANMLRAAARNADTLYGMMAAEALGLRNATPAAAPDFSTADWQSLRDVNNVRLAVQLAEIGADGLADDVLRYQARIGAPSQYAPLSRLARDLGLPSTQLWMAYNAPPGARADEAARFPAPKWVPANGWKVDPALLFAHSLQESNFRTAVTSPAGAKGLMQVLPGTARDMARADPAMQGRDSQLDLPDVNLAFGQTYLTRLRDNGATGGLLPKVIAAYNAGPMPVARWNSQVKDQGDPLLWMESIPYWETRGYVSAVMRNYWMYERQAGGPSESRIGLVQGLWPKFPGLSGADNVRVALNGN
ncbi:MULTISPECIES: lytic transglycosylase domain-containing protein [unclassified Novosphingobium]|uniref:lytic transglycosylase domain-containing protein n=1 Tax=unclassified Novosphingobium TaxID=2644732 RepID=UPI00146D487E|nr:MULTISPECIES: lytic transglycosylase domain-containing protein [unclassified Novosphingobium]NMN04191.1 soluble lytic murein transglycosylase-like protein [Novosphingobium sp. SG919]NMN85817.1 soluble lytic murein transglycosylase-like protein [Novosphingobium sp. SG916]